MSSGIIEQGSGETTTAQGASRSKLVQRLLTASANLPQFVNDLLTTQAVVVAGTEAAGFILERQEQGPGLRLIAHIRPDNSSAELRAAAIQAFQEIVKPCVTQGKDGAIEINAGDGAPEPQFCLITLLRSDGEVVAASAVITRCRNLERAQQRLMSMQLVAGYFELFTLRRTSEQAQIIAQSHQHVLQLATAVATAEGFESAAMNLCNELATRTGAGRVALGWVKSRGIKVKAFSHTEQFDKKQELVIQIEKVMEECHDQEEPVHYEPDGVGSANVSRAAQALSRSQGGNTVLSLPLRRRADIVGVVTLEFPPGHKLSQQASTGLAVAVDLLAPQLYDRYQNDRWLITKTCLSIRDNAGMIVGPKHMLSKLIVVAVLALGIFIFRFKPMYHVSARFQFDNIDKRQIDMPFEGYIKGQYKDKDGVVQYGVHVKPGDLVKKGDLLVELDDFDLINKRNDKIKDRDIARNHAQQYAADPTKQQEKTIEIDKAEQAQIEIDYYQHQIDLAHICAPIDGRIMKGDLTDQGGNHKNAGDELMVIAPDNSLRAELTVSERDIQLMKVGGHGELATEALPTDRFDFHIDRIVPMGKAEEGDNVFTVYALMDRTDPAWRPGTQGDARVDIARKPLAWIWTHKVIDYIRLKLWV